MTAVFRIIDPNGREVTAFRTEVSAAAGERAEFETISPTIAEPRLWSPDRPALYRLVGEVTGGERILDRLDLRFGFRWFRVDAREGFFLNGEPLQLYGTNRHQDLPGYGNALSDAAHRRDVRLVKDNGFNFLRLAHYPQDPAVLEAADVLGLVVWEEIPVVNLISTSKTFARNAETMLTEMIRQHYNHPSILMWGYMNEVLLQRPQPVPDQYDQQVVELARRLERRARADDPGRATVTAISFDEIDDGTGLQDIPRILGLNLYFGWYYRELDALGPFLDELHAKHPDRPLLISEYGAGSDRRVHAAAPQAFDFSVEHQQRFHEAAFARIRARPYLVGSAVWSQFDFASARRPDTIPGINQKGLYFHDRSPKDIAFFYRAALKNEPVLRIVAREWTARAGSRPGDARQTLVVYGNTDSIELFVNGDSVGSQAPDNATARWNVELQDGENRIEARGTRIGIGISDAVAIRYDDRSGLFSANTQTAGEIAINAGAAYFVVNEHELVWEPDRVYEENGWGHLGGRDVGTKRTIRGTGGQPLFQSARAGAEMYRFDVPDGEYEIRLGFAEIEHDEPGSRIFDVAVNETSVFSGLDLAAEYGPRVAVERAVRVYATDGNGVSVRLTARTGETTISSLHLRRL